MDTSKKDKMYALVDQWKESGLTRSAFSRQLGICERTFYYWCDKQSDRVSESSGVPEFIELASEPSVSEKSACPRIEIELAGEVVIKIY
jgi:transposase-like protein